MLVMLVILIPLWVLVLALLGLYWTEQQLLHLGIQNTPNP
jgi:hypothetical protein